MPEFDKRESVKVDDVEIMLGVLNRKLHEQLLETGLVTVAQWNSEIAPRLKAVADVLIGSRIHARSYRVHASSYPQAEHGAIAAKQAEIDRLMLEHCPGEMTPAQTAEWEKNQRPIVAPSAERSPIDMLLFCPRCGKQHIDAPLGEWTNPPHATHTCQHCGLLWRPSNAETNGVMTLPVLEEKHAARIEAAVPSSERERAFSAGMQGKARAALLDVSHELTPAEVRALAVKAGFETMGTEIITPALCTTLKLERFAALVLASASAKLSSDGEKRDDGYDSMGRHKWATWD